MCCASPPTRTEDSAPSRAPRDARYTRHTEIEGFQIIRRLGRGGMGEVFEAVRTGPGGFRRAVALKRLAGDDAVRGAAVQRFLAEARILASLHHPNVIEVYDVVAAPSGYVLVMELLRGATLGALARATSLAADELCAIADQALAGLAYVHAARGEDGRPLGLIHRDLTPNNLFVTDAGELKLIDFGIAKLRESLDAPLTREGELHGTLELIAPEQARGESPDPRTDLYQLAASLYWAITGCYPHGSGTHAELIARAATTRPPLLAELRPDLPRLLIDVIDRAMAIDRAARFATAADMRDALRPLVPADGEARLAARVQALAPPHEGESPRDGESRRDGDARPTVADRPSGRATAARRVAVRRRSWWPVAIIAAVGVGGGIVWFATRDAGTTSPPAKPGPERPKAIDVPGVAGAVGAVPLGHGRIAVATPTAVIVVPEAGGDRRELAIPPGTVPVDVEALANDRLAITVQSADGDYRTFVDGDLTHAVLYRSVHAATATHPDGIRIARADRGYAARLEGRSADGSVVVPVALGSEIVVALAWSPDGKQLAAIRDRGGADPTIDIVDVTTHAARTLTHRPFDGDIGLLGWLDDSELVYAVDRPDGAVLYRFAIATQRETELLRLPGERVLAGHVAAGAIAFVHARPRAQLLLGTASDLRGSAVDASSLAGFDPAGRVVLGRSAAAPVARAADAALVAWPGGEPGDRAISLVGDSLLAVRGGDLYRLGPAARRLTTAPNVRSAVRCAGDTAAPCAIVDASERSQRYRMFDPETAVAANDWLVEARGLDHALAADGAALAIADGTDTVRVYDVAQRKSSWRKIGGGATLEAVAWSGGDVIVSARAYREHGWALLAIDAANQIRTLAESPDRIAATIRTTGDRIAVLATDVTPVVSVLRP